MLTVGTSVWVLSISDRTERLHFIFSLSCIGEEMATHSSVLASRIPGMGEPDGLLTMGSHRVRHDWSDLAAAAAGKWQSHCLKLGSDWFKRLCPFPSHQAASLSNERMNKTSTQHLWMACGTQNQNEDWLLTSATRPILRTVSFWKQAPSKFLVPEGSVC